MTRTTTDRLKIRHNHPDSWVAVETGDIISGIITDVTDAWSDQRRDPVTGRQGAPYPLLTINATEATGYDNLPRELRVHCFGAVLFNEIMRKQPGVGEDIIITYQGPGKAREGQNAPELYSVRAASSAEVARRAYAAIPTGREAAARPAQSDLGEVQPELPTANGGDDIPF